ncbi:MULTISPECIES: GntR family transcriptional regulator [unclassified Bradyrhizobium]|uniref:GntR family transcriptional regulator n=1 Tax=unclassified Bradyrhizobium TaxID=2631580 RepID=UPI001FF8B331|nr:MULTISPECIES: GntR family transcriptional regulator [unclassified Bradyrhizobium]MCK1380081.1 GntR family transcriptional regulator [Bradyrhizobium sp. 24]MCK1296699.1 GntR family transcriptional regulator [Bradyrhizobium sp. 37]MCK1315960.1 GntR family transcriptional regulator [Bradyrhizobium sp. 23]MCK1398996.1 GntR family transcriptional regulator [Bradyrhizobium sp. 39]MCK1440439.1 GntR family transcriptional regulator [Bradyrhizobium sp. 15]
MMTDSESTTVAWRIAESIGERIISGAIQPDAPLRQDHVAREFNSSHVPVREAFRQLEAQHLVVAVPRRGVRVAPLDTNSVKEIAEMRAALEVVALRNAAPKFTSTHLARIELALIEGDNAQTIQDFEMANRAFHQALVAPCAMPRLLASLDGLQLANSRLVFAMARNAGGRPRSNQDHRLILQALRARNVDQACNLLARHIQTIERLALPVS